MATAYNIPLSPSPQTFQITLGGIPYVLTVVWRAADSGGWFLDIADANKNAILQGIPLVTGCDLLAQYGYLGFPGQLWVITPGDPTAVPGYTDLGVSSNLYFVTP
jgi:hypothetical protein